MLERDHNLSHRMTRELGSAIVCGEYEPHANLPTEADLCERFGVSRTAVREAVKMLSAKGLIASKPRQGIRVTAREDWNIFDPDLLGWSLEGNPSMEVLKEFLQMRIAIEPEAAFLGAQYARPERIKVIADALERMRVASDSSGDEQRQADIDFHISILYASENRFYIRMRDFIRTALNVSIRFTTLKKANYGAVLEDHSRVYHAIASGNSERAKSAMFFLIDDALGMIDAELQKGASTIPRPVVS